jgi:hypothetical protein
LEERAVKFGDQFDHLCRVVKEALSHGETRPGEVLLQSYRSEVKLLENNLGSHSGTQDLRHQRLKSSREKARRIARLLADASTTVDVLPNGFEPPNPYARAHTRRSRDPLANMKLTSRQAAAAKEIRTIFEYTTRSLQPWSRDLAAPRVDRSAHASDPWQYMPDDIAVRRAQVYMPWARSNRHVAVERRIGPVDIDRLTATNLVLTVLVDRVSLGVLEKRFHVHSKGSLGKVFRGALDDYAKIRSAWVDRQNHDGFGEVLQPDHSRTTKTEQSA